MSNTIWAAPVQCQIVLRCKIPRELDALKRKATGRRRRRRAQLSLSEVTVRVGNYVPRRDEPSEIMEILVRKPLR
jgi:hypothetical protein